MSSLTAKVAVVGSSAWTARSHRSGLLGSRKDEPSDVDRVRALASEDAQAELLAQLRDRSFQAAHCGGSRGGLGISPKLRRLRKAKPLLSRGLFVLGGFWFWLLQGQGDGGVEEFEDVSLGGGGLGEHGNGGLGSAEPDVVAGQGGEVVEEPAEGPDAVVGLVFAAGGLAVVPPKSWRVSYAASG